MSMQQAIDDLRRLNKTFKGLSEAADEMEKFVALERQKEELTRQLDSLRQSVGVEEGKLNAAKAGLASAGEEAKRIVQEARAEAELEKRAADAAANVAKADAAAKAEAMIANAKASASAIAAESAKKVKAAEEELDKLAASISDADQRKQAAEATLAALEAKAAEIRRQFSAILA